ncbi:MAG: hypothetical protein AAGG47_16680 [Pseudomonadota bacterium]
MSTVAQKRGRALFRLMVAWIAGLAVLAGATPSLAAPSACIEAGQRAAAAHGVPPALMQAVALVETGHRRDGSFVPWPWAMNAAGRGTWFDSRGEALAEAKRKLERGERNFDLGCFQINHFWHGEAFPSLERMIDPDSNATYAAEFLVALHKESGDWLVAAGHYHSRTPKHATAYRARLRRQLARLGGLDAVGADPVRVARGADTRPMGTRHAERNNRARSGAVGPLPATSNGVPGGGVAASGTADGTAGALAPAPRFLRAGAGRALIEVATNRLILPAARGPLIARLPGAGRTAGRASLAGAIAPLPGWMPAPQGEGSARQ